MISKIIYIILVFFLSFTFIGCGTFGEKVPLYPYEVSSDNSDNSDNSDDSDNSDNSDEIKEDIYE
ncbi:hypothetical protein ACP3VU_16375 [Vibrio sp. PNB23_22_6]